jgi:hypothetical protein
MDLLAVRFFSSLASYNAGDFVQTGGQLYSAKAAVVPGAFNATQWNKVSVAGDPITGGSINGTPIGNTTPSTGAFTALSTPSAAITGGSIDNTVIGGTTPAAATVTSLNGWQLAGTRNLVHNGAFEVDQRYGGVTTTMNAANQYCADRWMFVSTQVNKFSTTSAVSTALSLGMTRCLEAACIAAVPSLAAGDNWSLQHRIEGLDFARLGYGGGYAQSTTLSFVAYSTLAGTYAVSIRNSAGNRSFVQTFVLAASTWTKFAIPIPGDTAGTWLSDTGIGGIVTFSLASGTTWNAPAAGSWQAGNFMSVAGTTNFLSATPTFYISSVQLELGNAATPFEHINIAQKLAICQRYYWQDTYTYLVFNGAAATQIVSGIIKFPQVMRAAPTMTYATAPTVVETTTSHLLAYGNVAATSWLPLGLVTASADI